MKSFSHYSNGVVCGQCVVDVDGDIWDDVIRIRKYLNRVEYLGK